MALNNSFSPAFSMPQWGMPQITPTPQVQIPGMEDPSAGFLPDGASYGISQPTMPGGSSFMGGFLGNKENPGWGGAAMGAAGGLFNAWMGMKQYGLAKDTLETNKQQFTQNFEAQRKMTNSRLADRQASRIGSSGGANSGYQSVGDYMKSYGV